MEVFCMTAEAQQTEYPYFVKIETSTGQSANVPIAFLTAQQIENFLQFDFKRLVEEAGIKGARIHVERATTADYEKVLGEVTTCLRTAAGNVEHPASSDRRAS
jgi:hypothetical protein